MTLAEPSSVLLETGGQAVFQKADDSATVTTRGILEDGATERDSGETTRQQADWQITVPTSAVGTSYGEGDKVTYTDPVTDEATEYEILDVLARDCTMTVFALATP